MEEENKIHQSPPDTCTYPVQHSDSGNDPPPPTAANNGAEFKTKDPDTVRESKRRKSCPSALDKFEACIRSCCNSSFSFTFDPQFCSGATTPEVTPKFGSFNLVAPTAAAAEIRGKIEQKTVDEEEEEEEEEDEVIEKRKIVELLDSVDGIQTAD